MNTSYFAIAVTLLAASPVSAQERQAQETSDVTSNAASVPQAAAVERVQAAPSELSDIVVTATKAPTSLVQTPASITVLDANRIATLGARSLDDVSAFVPNLRLVSTLGAGDLGSITVRGLGNGNGSFDPSVAVYIDDVPYADFYSYFAPLVDIERIELLRGPQGALYGASAEAGVLNVTSRQPGDSWRGLVTVEAASIIGGRALASVSGPIVGHTLRIGLAGSYEDGKTDIRNAVTDRRGDRRLSSYRGQIAWAPSPAIDVLGTIYASDLKEGLGLQYLPIDRAAYDAANGTSLGKFENADDFDGRRENKTWGQSLRVTARTGAADIVGVVAHRVFHGPYALDFDNSPADIYRTEDATYDTENSYGELRIQSPAGARDFIWLVGASWSEQKIDSFYKGVYLGIYPTSGDFNGSGRNAAVFGQATLRLLDSRLGLTGGLRYEDSRRSGIFQERATFGYAGPPSFRVTDHALLPKIGIDYRVDPDTTLYANYAVGWRNGGGNFYAYAGPTTYTGEFAHTAEGGIHQKVGGVLTLSAAGFYTWVRDYQEAVPQGNGTGYLDNVPKVTIPGFEIEANAVITPRLRATASVGYARARYDDYPRDRTLEGTQLPNTPDWTWAGALTYALDSVTAGVNLRGGSAFTSTSTAGTIRTRVAGYAAADLFLSWALGPWTVRGFVTNVTNNRYFLNASYALEQPYGSGSGNIVQFGVPGRPREFGLSLSRRFGEQ